MPWKDYAPHAAGGTAGAGIFFLIFKDGIKEWWDLKKQAAREAREEKAIERGRGSNLENKLIGILERDLASNASLLTRLTDTMN